jgi:radical SAM superfamily enzyme YgiQ (UPF0313 family)
MRILFIVPNSEIDINNVLPKSIDVEQGVPQPLGIGYLAAVLEQDRHEVKILDALLHHLSRKAIQQEIEKFNPDVVGMTAMTSSIPDVIEMAKLIKEVNKNIKVVIGGPHLSAFPREPLSLQHFDFGVFGDGEYTMQELINEIQGRKRFNNIKGLIWKSGGEVIVNQPRLPIENLDAIPFPAYHLMDMDMYGMLGMKKPMSTMIATRGCPFNCAYCFKDPIWKRFRKRSPKNIVDEMEYIISTYGVKEIAFYNDCWPSKEFVRELCLEMIKRKVDVVWETPQRVDFVDPELLCLMKRAGCIKLRFGVESGSKRILKLMNKGITLEKARLAFKWSREIGIKTFAYFMVGYITESRVDFEQTVEFSKEIDPDWAMYAITTPFPATKLWDMAVEYLNFDPDYWKDFSLGERMDRLPYCVPDAVERCCDAYRRFYYRPKAIMRKFLEIRTFNDLITYAKGSFAILKSEEDDKVIIQGG